MLFASGSASALGLDTYPEEPTEAEASVAGMSLGGEDLFGLAQSQAGSESDPGPNTEAFNGAIGGGEVVDFGSGYQIPLADFLEFGEAGVVQSQSTASDGQNGEAITGIAGADGGLTLDGTDGEFGTARINLLSILEASGADTITDEMVDRAELNFGLGGAWVEAIDGEFQDPDAVGEFGQYRVGDLNLELHSPAIDAAGDGLSDAAGQMEQEVTDTINDTLDLGSALPVPGLTVETEVSSTLQEDVLDATLLGPIATDDGLAEINLGEGTVMVDLARIGGNDDGVIDRPVGINNQDPNTELIDDETYPFVASSVHDVIEEVVDLSVGTAMDSLESVSVSSSVTAPDGTTASWDMTLNGEVTNFECTPGGLTGAVTCATLEGAMSAMGPVMSPINDALSDPEGVIYQAFTTIKTDLMTVPVRAALDPFLELIASNLFSVQINHQEVQTCEMPDGTEATSGLEVSALSIGVLDGTARLGIGNAGVRIDACDLAAEEPVIDASTPAPAGGESTLTGEGWTPDTDVSVQLTDPDGAPVGDPVTVTTDENGAFPEGTVLPVPEDATPGDGFTVTATDPEGNEATDTLEVTEADAAEVTIDASSPVVVGDESTLTSEGWAPNTDVAVQLTDAEGNPVGDPVTVSTDENGAFPEGTVLPVPEDATPGDGFTVTATDPEGNEATDTISVVAADAPLVDASSPAPAGGESTLTGEGWTPDTDVSVQLTDPEGNPVGDPVTVTTDEN
ncbi:choice-of-anchor G family protein, partial [Brachybacterium sp. FME24]|uniref:choice-of-anchor G family protein n=1 Tax=Brachybacterium sp. FME24 TaxID=2742605 RepID=UPI00186825EB